MIRNLWLVVVLPAIAGAQGFWPFTGGVVDPRLIINGLSRLSHSNCLAKVLTKTACNDDRIVEY